jgi:hypothetical protein
MAPTAGGRGGALLGQPATQHGWGRIRILPICLAQYYMAAIGWKSKHYKKQILFGSMAPWINVDLKYPNIFSYSFTI